MVVTTCKGMSLCGKEGHMVVTTCKGMSRGKEGYLVVTTCKGMSLCGKEGHMVVTWSCDHMHARRDVTTPRDATLW